MDNQTSVTVPAGGPQPTSGGGAANPLQQLQLNLSQLYAKDNPLVQNQTDAATTYLNTLGNSATANTPSASNPNNVNGVNLALSPEELQSVISNRQNAALANLASRNSLVTSSYGTIPAMVQQAATWQGLQLQAQQQALAQAQFAWMKQQLNPEQAGTLGEAGPAAQESLLLSHLLGGGTSLNPLQAMIGQSPLLTGLGNATGGIIPGTRLSPQQILLANIAGTLGQNPLAQRAGGGNISALLSSGQANPLLNQILSQTGALTGQIEKSTQRPAGSLLGQYLGNSGSQTTAVQGPDGKVYDIPTELVPQFVAQGGTLSGQ